jgi:AraC family transcriptional regulator
MHRVLEHIDRQLDQPLDGETLGDYLRRRRVEIAATRLLAQPRVPVLQLALSVGFGSAEAFARAFKKRFGCSPTLWRRQQSALRPTKSNPGQMERNIDQILPPNLAENDAHHLSPEASMKVELVDRQRTTVAYLRHVGPYGAPIATFWQQTVYPWMATNGLLQQPRYGISHDDPTITAPAQCRYDAGCELPPALTTLGNALKTAIPGGRYAALSFKGTVADIEAAWTAMLRDWLPTSGLQLDDRIMFEYYPRGSNYDPATGVFDCKLCVPVAPL